MLNFDAWSVAFVDALALHLLLAVQLLPVILSPSRNTGFLKPTQTHTHTHTHTSESGEQLSDEERASWAAAIAQSVAHLLIVSMELCSLRIFV